MASSIDPSAILGQLTESYMKLPLVQKILFPVLIVASVSGIIFVSKWANQPEYVTLFSDLEPADSASVIERLKDLKVAYQVEGGGSIITISPPTMVHELRMTLAGEGVVQGGKVGLEIFEATNLGTTSFQEKVKFVRAIQGELERTIESLDAVHAARVHIAQPEKSVFANKDSQATASVMLRLSGRSNLEPQQIKGIAHLVAGSVEGLSVENVTILDANGSLLTTPEDEAGDQLQVEATRLSYQREIEKGYVRRIEQVLSKVLGHGKAIARVTAEMDFTQSEREEETFDPGGQVLRSERVIEEGINTARAGGIPGVISNIASPGASTLDGPNPEGSARSEAVKNYEVSRAVSRTRSPQGRLNRISVAVVVDGTYETVVAEDGTESKAFKALPVETLEQIESVVKSAVGYDAARGDSLTVENIAFSAPSENFVEQMDAKATQDMIFNAIFRAGPVLFLVLFFFVIVRPLVRFIITPTEAELDLERLLPTGLKELEQELDAERNKRGGLPQFEQTIDLEQLEELMAENSRIVQENPQQAALLIRYWLNDGRI
ncbi:MAG: flagellar M-ring protein FliF [Bdellovibrionales bacterium]|nr:flagellar M-ring protein FliF [Bdellovibrionales bacterium]